ncbi:acyl carrier protein [Lentzea sp.]|uniref:acyl carrier protein n=1 Tax=Lentzea sp. TaxID=56099 RepID=UPI002C6E2624|nr:acyl carrier protein [Lentzea sp.]HUQ58556.1 acyl carrier protein [Lentzea sp.]
MQTTLESEIRDFVLTTIVEDLGQPLPDDTVSDQITLGATGLDLDSLSLIELTMRLERRFSVQYPDDSIEPVGAMTLGELVADTVARGAKA